MSTTSSLLIEELTGNKTVIVLKGPGLPLMGASWKATNRVITTWYPGNPDEGSQQVLGRQEIPSKWQGEWNLTRMNRSPSSFNGSQIIDPMLLVQAFEDIQLGGARLRVTWVSSAAPSGADPPDGLTQSVKIVREGRLTDFEIKVTRATDVEWDAQFDWASRGKTQQRNSATRPPSAADTSALQAAINSLVAAAKANANAKTAPTGFDLGFLSQLAALPTSIVDDFNRQVLELETEVGQLVDIANTVAGQPAAVSGAAVAIGQSVVDTSNNFQDELGRVPPELLASRGRADLVLQATNTFGQQQVMNAKLIQQARAYVERAQRQAAQHDVGLGGSVKAQQAASPDTILAIIPVREGDTPIRLSQRYYGSPDHAIDILKANQLPWYLATLPVGSTVLIPRLSSLQGRG